MSEISDEERVRRKKANKKRSGQREADGREVRDEAATDATRARVARGTTRSWTSLAAVVSIVLAVVAIPLYLKSKPSVDVRAEPSGESTPPSIAARAITRQALPRFVDLGTTTCMPCKVMLGVMAELERDYPGAFVVDFVNLKEDPDEAARYNIQTIPTQIFYAPDGRELYRHVGVFRAEEIIAKWAEFGYRFERTAAK